MGSCGAFIPSANGSGGGGGGGDVGPGTIDQVAKFTAADAVGDSSITDDGTLVTIANPVAVQAYLARRAAITPAALASGTTQNYALASMAAAGRIRQATDAANSAIGGLVPVGGDGDEFMLINLGPGTLTLNHEDAGSVAANRFLLEGAANRVIAINGAVLISYDATSARWYCVG